jgi:dTDP-L-rhamnose 4-epimerase
LSKNILITGGAGFIGSSLSLELIKQGYIVTVFDNLLPQIHGEDKSSYSYNSIKDKVKFIHGDVRSGKDLLGALQNQNIIIHLAAETGTGQSMYRVSNYSETNIQGTSLLADLIINNNLNIEKVILSSSRSIYGEGKYRCEFHDIVYPDSRKVVDLDNADYECKCPKCGNTVTLMPTDEDCAVKPISFYAATKYSQELIFKTVFSSVNIPFVIFRFQNVYGSGQSLKNPYTGILSIFSTQIKNGNDLNIFEDGLESRDFVSIDDVVDVVASCIENKRADFQTLNVGSGERQSVLKVAELLKEKYNSDVKINVSGNYRVGDIRHNFADINKIKSLLNYKPKVSFQDGISKFIEWVENQEIYNDLYEKSLLELKEKGLYK